MQKLQDMTFSSSYKNSSLKNTCTLLQWLEQDQLKVNIIVSKFGLLKWNKINRYGWVIYERLHHLKSNENIHKCSE